MLMKSAVDLDYDMCRYALHTAQTGISYDTSETQSSKCKN